MVAWPCKLRAGRTENLLVSILYYIESPVPCKMDGALLPSVLGNTSPSLGLVVFQMGHDNYIQCAKGS